MQKVLALESSLSKEIWWITTPLEIYKTRYSRMLKNILNRLALQIKIVFIVKGKASLKSTPSRGILEETKEKESNCRAR